MAGTATISWFNLGGGGGGGAIALDTSTSQTFSGNGDWTFSYTCTGSNRYLIVSVSAGTGAITGITYNGVSMSLIASETHISRGTDILMWGLVAPATGSHTIDITITGAPGVLAANISSWTGVNQSTPIGTPAGAQADSNSEASVNVSSASNEIVVDAVYNHLQTVTYGVQTSLGDAFNSDDNMRCTTSYKTGSTTTTMLRDLATADDWAIVAIPLKP